MRPRLSENGGAGWEMAFIVQRFPMPPLLPHTYSGRTAGRVPRCLRPGRTSGLRFLLHLAVLGGGFLCAPAAVPTPAAADAAPSTRLFAVQIRTGPKWDVAKPPPQQQFFAEHSANLRRLREKGHLILGARYGEVGLVVLSAESEAHARMMMDEDPSFGAGVFRYEVHPFNVFYPGTVEAPRRTR